MFKDASITNIINFTKEATDISSEVIICIKILLNILVIILIALSNILCLLATYFIYNLGVSDNTLGFINTIAISIIIEVAQLVSWVKIYNPISENTSDTHGIQMTLLTTVISDAKDSTLFSYGLFHIYQTH
jgi:hypothetical protein